MPSVGHGDLDPVHSEVLGSAVVDGGHVADRQLQAVGELIAESESEPDVVDRLTGKAINGGLAALGALLARAHPLTVLSAVIAAPLTSLNPTIAAGMVTGLVESWLRKPRVSDLENLRFDITTVRGWFRNPATRILLVFFLSNLGSAIGTWVAGFKIFGALS